MEIIESTLSQIILPNYAKKEVVKTEQLTPNPILHKTP